MNFIRQDTETLEECVTKYEEYEVEAVRCLECLKPIGDKEFVCEVKSNELAGVLYCCWLKHKTCVKEKK